MTSNKIQTSLDWNAIEIDLCNKSHNLTHRRDIKRLIKNIRLEVTKLSKAEVLARNSQSHLAETILDRINNDIETVEGFLLVGALLG